ncbi:DUF6233 domain-containing protein [Streptomyces sp. CG1]|uniref:DUF6233 domain-containing protein n=1 Tax=Streptomyces sp. CG1 TaxID=1287523 RepID=UPI0034E26A8C
MEGTPHGIRTGEARAALAGPTIEPCPFCRPVTELGSTSAEPSNDEAPPCTALVGPCRGRS